MICCILALAACKNNTTPTTTNPPNTTSETKDSTTEPEKTIGEYKRPGFEEVDFDGKVFTIAVPVGKGDGWDNYDIAPDDENSPDPLDQAF